MVGNTTYSIYFDLYGNLAAGGQSGGVDLVTDLGVHQAHAGDIQADAVGGHDSHGVDGHTKVIPALEKLTDTDWANLQSIFANADRNNSGMVTGSCAHA